MREAMKLTILTAAALGAALLSSPAKAEDSVLRTLPTAVQKQIGDIRDACRENLGGEEDADVSGLKGDDGLATFTVSGANAVPVDELAFCGGECHHGVNCATGFTHDVAIYIRSGKSWRKALSVVASGPTFLDTDDNGKFNAFVLRVFAGDKGCQARRSPIIESRQTCARVLRWDEKAKQFVYKPL
jgi:hypothetical protein